MKLRFLFATCCVAFTALGVYGDQLLLGSTNQIAWAHQLIGSYLNGKVDLHEFTTNKDVCDAITNYYLLHEDELPVKAKLPVSCCFAMNGSFAEAASVAKGYVDIYSNDWHGWRVLGISFLMTKAYDQSIQAYTNAISAGDSHSYLFLAGVAMIGNRMDVFGGIVPQLIAFKNDKHVSKQERIQAISLLLMYADKTYQKSIFVKTLQGEHMNNIVEDGNIRTNIDTGCSVVFKGEDIDKIRVQFNAALAERSQHAGQ